MRRYNIILLHRIFRVLHNQQFQISNYYRPSPRIKIWTKPYNTVKLPLVLHTLLKLSAKMANFTVINGPNLNLLGVREPGLYGNKTLSDIQQNIENLAQTLNHIISFHQSNAEHEIIKLIHDAYATKTDFIIINPAAFTHTSVAIRDALLATKIPFIEVHLSNVYSREPFRKHSYFSDIASGVICGLGAIGYELALQAAHQFLAERQ